MDKSRDIQPQSYSLPRQKSYPWSIRSSLSEQIKVALKLIRLFFRISINYYFAHFLIYGKTCTEWPLYFKTHKILTQWGWEGLYSSNKQFFLVMTRVRDWNIKLLTTRHDFCLHGDKGGRLANNREAEEKGIFFPVFLENNEKIGIFKTRKYWIFSEL